jgi:hypothetical protein
MALGSPLGFGVPQSVAVEQLVVRMATENPTWGYTQLVGALANLGHQVGRNSAYVSH